MPGASVILGAMGLEATALEATERVGRRRTGDVERRASWRQVYLDLIRWVLGWKG